MQCFRSFCHVLYGDLGTGDIVVKKTEFHCTQNLYCGGWEKDKQETK